MDGRRMVYDGTEWLVADLGMQFGAGGPPQWHHADPALWAYAPGNPVHVRLPVVAHASYAGIEGSYRPLAGLRPDGAEPPLHHGRYIDPTTGSTQYGSQMGLAWYAPPPPTGGPVDDYELVQVVAVWRQVWTWGASSGRLAFGYHTLASPPASHPSSLPGVFEGLGIQQVAREQVFLLPLPWLIPIIASSPGGFGLVVGRPNAVDPYEFGYGEPWELRLTYRPVPGGPADKYHWYT